MVKACSYCGRENQDHFLNCRECGTEFPVAPSKDTEEEKVSITIEEPLTDLSGLNMGFELVEGFSRPDWKKIYEFTKSPVPREDLPAVWNNIVKKWLDELASDLGGSSHVRRTENFFCLSDLDAETTKTLLNYAEFAVGTIRVYLRKAAWSGYNGKHVLLLFADPEDYYSYISYFYRVGTHILTGGIFIRKGYAHVALPFKDMLSAQHTLAHELTHNLLCHLPIPTWLNEGLAVVMERAITRRGFMLDGDLIERHRNHWNEANIQAFWSGKSYNIPGDDSELSYSLGEILVNLISEKDAGFIEFVKAADWRDAGQDAAVNHFGQGLEDFLGGFLGSGNWRPQRKAISATWKSSEQI
jgi:hypothetical protein